MSEADLYEPVKRFLEGQGYAVKGEIGACDVVAVREGEPPVIVELKQRLTLGLLLQAVDRLTVSDAVYIAFRVGKGRSGSWRKKRKQVERLCRRLGLGLLTVSKLDRVVPVLDPAPYRPRKNTERRSRLLREFAERVGDPEAGGSSARRRLTVYRQDALRLAAELSRVAEAAEVAEPAEDGDPADPADEDALKVAELRDRTGVQRAGPILRDNHYGWFERARRGYYRLTPRGHSELDDWAEAVETLTPLEGADGD